MQAHHPDTHTPAPEFVGEVMTTAVVSAHALAPFREIAAALARNRVSGVPVLDEQRRVIGVVTASDLLARLSHDRGPAPRGHRLTGRAEMTAKSRGRTAADLMTSPAVTVRADTAISEAAVLAAREHVRYLPVVDEAGALIGVVTKTDLARYYGRADADLRSYLVDHVLREKMLLEPTAVEISVCEGVVTLDGFVEPASVAQQLVALVEQTPGVVSVVDHLRHRVPGEH